MDEYRHGAGHTTQRGYRRHPGRVGEHRDGTALDRVGGMACPVGGRSCQRREQIAWLHRLSAQRHARDQRVRDGRGSMWAIGEHRSDLNCQLSQRHTWAGAGAQHRLHLAHHLRPTADTGRNRSAMTPYPVAPGNDAVPYPPGAAPAAQLWVDPQ